MTLAELVDVGLLALATFTPVLFVLRWERRGVLLGAAFSWLTLIAAGHALSALDEARDAAMLDSIWLLFGWVGTLAYSCLIYLTVRITRALWARRADRLRVDKL